jgi:hypothetical protein
MSPALPERQQNGPAQNEQSKMNVLIAQYKGVCDCTLCTPAQGGTAEELLKQIRQDTYKDIMAHEMAHQSAAGAYGGGIVIDYDGNGVAIGGHVPISFPGLDAQAPETSLQAYKTIYNAALAPDDPSGQDKSLAGKATGLMGQAQDMVALKREFEKMGIKPGSPEFKLQPGGGRPAKPSGVPPGNQPADPSGSRPLLFGSGLSIQA